MNGSLLSKTLDIKLKRGPAGLGFNIVGGVDQHYIDNDCGIYVSKIKEDGAAALDGRLEEGDRILAINGIKLEDQTHKAAVDLFRTAGEDVELRVLKKSSHHTNGPFEPQDEHVPPAPYLGIFAALSGAAAVILAFVYIRHIRRPF
ncbi:synaptojanin-2-binding protein [Corythoichthys intestinalis]|uniref:synaptojanin-2-binding protein n=1 Tax=Corythoichthys intestinalis TaxID=161448 RepID=UPI0025A5C2F9|nr:synaptojanin-2-binding protein [Corythoichthys intestinalis]XP_061798356.1 synaptojanin-2-binding protein-like [Nerophis lumbriciformis]